MPPTDDITAERARYSTSFAGVAGIAAAVVGCVVLLGWLVGNEVLKGAVIDDVNMKANTALCFVLLGIATFLTAHPWSGRLAPWVRTLCAVVTSLIGLATLSEHAIGWNLGIDQLLFTEPPNAAATASPGRMGPPAATSFFILGVALILLRQPRPRPLWGQWLGVTAAMIGLPGVLGRLYGAGQLYLLSQLTGIALPSAMVLALLGAATVAARPDTGLALLIVREAPGGAVLRRIVLPAMMLLIVVGWATILAQKLGWADAAVAAALEVVFVMICLLVIGAHNARVLNAIARGRDTAERERERLLESERAARKDAERAVRVKDEFLTTVSHELRTPLSGILGWTHVLQQATDAATRTKALEAIERGARAQAQLINDLLDTSSIVSGKTRLQVATVDVGPLVEAALATLTPNAEAKGIQLQRVIDPHAGLVKGDRERLQQVFWNLIGNAIKFTPKGGRVQVVVERAASSVTVSISDNGIGIAPEFLPRVFDRFRQADSSATRSYGGLGLGLAIVRHIVDMHGGTVTAESAGQGRGATFTVAFPIALAAIGASLGDADGSRARLGDLRGVRVLLVDDDHDSLESIRLLLTDCGAEVGISNSGSEALARLEQRPPDVLVADIGMPNMDGYSLIRALRERESRQARRTPAIAMTAFSRAEDRIRALDAGFNFHLTKPVDVRELIAVIASLVQQVRPSPGSAPGKTEITASR